MQTASGLSDSGRETALDVKCRPTTGRRCAEQDQLGWQHLAAHHAAHHGSASRRGDDNPETMQAEALLAASAGAA
jgi:hypothetical protein